jgi:hypothetical protein
MEATYFPNVFCTVQNTVVLLAELPIAAVGMAWLLPGSPWNGKAALYFFQKHLFHWGVH